MNKRTTSTIKATKVVNYPDVLGAITGNKRLNVDVLQVAVATRPASIRAGSPFDALIILQNATNADADAVIRVLIPEVDLAGNKGRFSTTIVKPIRIGLRAAEVGYASFPISCTALTAPGKGYSLQLEVQVEQKQAGRAPRGANQVRDANGGAVLNLEELNEERRQEITGLQVLDYSVTAAGKPGGNKATLVAPFEVLPAALSGFPQARKPGYMTLWTLADNPDEAMLAEKVQPLTAAILPQLKRDNVFFPLLKATQAHFERAGLRLWAGEALMIAKLLTLVLEMGVQQPLAGVEAEAQVTFPRWFVRLCRLLIQNPRAASQIEPLVAEALYQDLVYDAVLLGFAMLTTVTKQEFGTPEEIVTHANQITAGLAGQGTQINLTLAYLPLVMAGLISNSRVSMPQEQVRDSANLLATAREKRAAEANDSNKIIFDLIDDLIQRALEHF